MSDVFRIAIEEDKDGVLLVFGFGKPFPTDRIIQEVSLEIKHLIRTGQLPGGKLIKIFGPQPVQLGWTIAPFLNRIYETVAVYVPASRKEPGYYVVTYTSSQDLIEGDRL